MNFFVRFLHPQLFEKCQNQKKFKHLGKILKNLRLKEKEIGDPNCD